MDLLAHEEILKTRAVSARLQVSSSRKLARIDMYYLQNNMPKALLRKLERLGWRLLILDVGWNVGIVGRIYEHDQPTAQTHREAKAVFLGRTEPDARAKDIVARLDRGETQRQVAQHYGISYQRVSQIAKRAAGPRT